METLRGRLEWPFYKHLLEFVRVSRVGVQIRWIDQNRGESSQMKSVRKVRGGREKGKGGWDKAEEWEENRGGG